MWKDLVTEMPRRGFQACQAGGPFPGGKNLLSENIHVPQLSCGHERVSFMVHF